MSKLDILGRSNQTTHIWIKEAAKELNWKDERRAFLALRAVLHALRDRLTIEEGVHLGAQLPTLIRGSYYDGWRPKKHPQRDSTRYAFLGEVQAAFAKTHDPQVDSVHIARAIFRLLNKKVSSGEITDVLFTLPQAVRDLWPEMPKKKTGPGSASKKSRRVLIKTHAVDELIDAARDNGRAVLGLAQTLQALNCGRVWEIIHADSEAFFGCECPRCAGLFPPGNGSCQYCGAALVFLADLSDRIRERAAERGVKLERVRGKRANALIAAGGIGAFLKTTRAARLGLE
jgi:uncharacterized protein (DUF2267 family)